MRRFARNPRQFVQRLRRGWRTRRGWMLITDIASAVAGVLLMFTVRILNAWGFRRALPRAG